MMDLPYECEVCEGWIVPGKVHHHYGIEDEIRMKYSGTAYITMHPEKPPHYSPILEKGRDIPTFTRKRFDDEDAAEEYGKAVVSRWIRLYHGKARVLGGSSAHQDDGG